MPSEDDRGRPGHTPHTDLGTNPAGDAWRAALAAADAQAARLRDDGWAAAADPFQSMVQTFRADRAHEGDAVLRELRSLVRPDDVVLDVGAGAGRHALPLARIAREVIAVEPSASMRSALTEDAARVGLDNVRIVPSTWEDAPDIQADVAYAVHAIYHVHQIEHFLRRLHRAARRIASIATFVDPPQYRLFPFWRAVFDEDRLPLPHLPHALAVLDALGINAHVTKVVEPLWPLGPTAVARQKLRRRLGIVGGSAADRRLALAMQKLLTDWGGALGPVDSTQLDIGVIWWRKEEQS